VLLLWSTSALLAPRSSVLKNVKACNAVPVGTAWAVGSIGLGAIPTPIVANAIKKWYARRLVKPSWTPPDRIFAPTWTILYGLLGLAAGRVAHASGAFSSAMIWAYSHFALNLVWAPIFFGLKFLRLGALINVSLLSSLFVVITKFNAIDPTTPYLLAPYLVWLSFATVLNFEICRLNPNGVPHRGKSESSQLPMEGRGVIITPPPPSVA